MVSPANLHIPHLFQILQFAGAQIDLRRGSGQIESGIRIPPHAFDLRKDAKRSERGWSAVVSWLVCGAAGERQLDIEPVGDCVAPRPPPLPSPTSWAPKGGSREGLSAHIYAHSYTHHQRRPSESKENAYKGPAEPPTCPACPSCNL